MWFWFTDCLFKSSILIPLVCSFKIFRQMTRKKKCPGHLIRWIWAVSIMIIYHIQTKKSLADGKHLIAFKNNYTIVSEITNLTMNDKIWYNMIKSSWKKKENTSFRRPFMVFSMPHSEYTLTLLLWINIFSEF